MGDGQVGKAVHDFRVTLCGVSIADTFYPAHLELTPKGADSRQTACRLLKELHGFIAKLAASKGLLVPNLFGSADSGFDGPALLDTCALLGEVLPMPPICVPKKSNLIKCGASKGNSAFIEKEFLPQEAAHIQRYAEKKQQPPPFTLRVRANYVSRKQPMVFLFFRLRGSKKVGVIYTSPPMPVVQEFLSKAFQAPQRMGFFQNSTAHRFRRHRKTDVDRFAAQPRLIFCSPILLQTPENQNLETNLLTPT